MLDHARGDLQRILTIKLADGCSNLFQTDKHHRQCCCTEIIRSLELCKELVSFIGCVTQLIFTVYRGIRHTKYTSQLWEVICTTKTYCPRALTRFNLFYLSIKEPENKAQLRIWFTFAYESNTLQGNGKRDRHILARQYFYVQQRWDETFEWWLFAASADDLRSYSLSFLNFDSLQLPHRF